MAGAALRPARLGLILPWAIFALLCLAYGVYWVIVERAAIAQVEQAFAQARAAGADAGYRRIRSAGFPLRLSLRLEAVAYAPADRAWRAEAPAATLHVNLSNPRHVILALDAPARWLTNAGAAYALEASVAALSVRFAGDRLARASLDLQGLSVRRADGEAGGFQLARGLAHLRPDARTPGAYQLAAEIDTLTPARPVRGLEGFGQTVQRVRAAIAVDQAAALARPNPLKAWRDAGGGLRIEALEIGWGPAQATGDGAIGLDPAGRPAGSLTLSTAQPRAVLTALAQSSLADPTARAALQAAAALAPAQGATALTLSAQNGVLSALGTPLAPLQSLLPARG